MIKINGKPEDKDIKDLDLSYNQLTQIPSVIWQLTQLTELDLSSNQLTQLPS